MQALAHFIASHPFASFAVLALLMLAASGLLWAMVRRLREPVWQWTAGRWRRVAELSLAQRLSQRYRWLRVPQHFAGSYLLLDLLAGFSIVAGALALFFEIADEIDIDESLGRFDDLLSGELRASLSAQALQAYAFVTHLADTWTLATLCVLVAIVLLWRRQHLLAGVWIVAIAGNGLLNRLLKALFGRSRPLHDHGWTVEHGWSFPSGHSSGAMVAYGMLAYLLILLLRSAWHLPVVLAAVTVILLVGFSRIVLQVHYFSDVLAGFLSGGIWLLCCIAAVELARRRSVAPR